MMGWSCAAKAKFVYDELLKVCHSDTERSSNVILLPRYGRVLVEASRREHADGAITGQLYRFLEDGQHVRKCGSFRISGEGQIERFPGLDAKAKEEIERIGLHYFRMIYEPHKMETWAHIFRPGAGPIR